MPPRRHLAALVAALCLVLATPTAAGAAERGAPGATGRAGLDVATYNVYLGADLNPLFAARSFPELVGRAGQVYAAMESTDFRERAGAIADAVAKERPDVVGLQEVALGETAPGTVQAPGQFTTTYDFLDLLLTALADRGLGYEAVATNANFTGTLPISLGGAPPLFPGSTWARFTDHDVVIVRTGLPARQLSVDRSSAVERNYDAFLTIPSGVPGLPAFVVPRGWSSVDVTAKGSTFRFFNTHLEAFGGDAVRNMQAGQLAAQVEASPYPPIVVGDINSRPPGCSTNTVAFQRLLDAGLVEVWPLAHPRDPCGGVTSGQAADLLNAESLLDHRIDVVRVPPGALTAPRAEVLGDEQRDRSRPTGMWPSDHAGSVASLKAVRP